MTYTSQTWQNGPAGLTPLSAPRFMHMEGGIQEASDRLTVVEGLIKPGANAYNSQQLVTANDAPLQSWRAGLANRHFSRCDVVCIGDSITEGQGATVITNRWLARLRDILRTRFPTNGVTTGGRGYLNAVSTGEVSYTWPTTVAGSPPTVLTGPKYSGIQFNATGQSVTYNLTGDSADIMWEQVGFGGTFSYQVDANTAVNISTNGGSTQDGMLTHVSLGTAGAHTLKLAWVSGNSNVSGVIEYNGDYSTGITVHDAGHYGWKTSDWVSALGGGAAQAIAALSPNVIVITLGVNDQYGGVTPSTYQTNLQTIITSLLGGLTTPYPSIVLSMMPPRVGQSGYSYPWSQYVNAAWSIQSGNTNGPGGTSLVSVLDFTLGRMGGADTDTLGLWHAGDTVHPSNIGHSMIADFLVEFLNTP